MGGTSSDFDGNYDINPIPPGTYDLKASCIGYNPFVVKNIVIPANKITFYDIKMASGAINIGEVTVVDYEIPLISKDNTTQGASITSEEIAKLPVPPVSVACSPLTVRSVPSVVRVKAPSTTLTV